MLRFQLVLPAFAAAEKAQMKGDYILLAGIDEVENSSEIIERVVVADHHQHIFGPNSEGPWRQVIARLNVELIELGMRAGPLASDLFRDLKHGEEDDGESDA